MVNQSVRSRSVPRASKPFASPDILRWVTLSMVGLTFFIGAFWAVSGMLSAGGSVASASNSLSQSDEGGTEVALGNALGSRVSFINPNDSRQTRLAKEAASKAERDRRIDILRAVLAQEKMAASNQRFERARMEAALTPEKVAEAFGITRPQAPAKAKQTFAARIQPSPARFASASAAMPSMALAYADPAQDNSGGLAALSILASLNTDDALPGDDDQLATVPDYDLTPDDGPLPLRRPHFENSLKPDETAAKPEPKAVRAERAAPSDDRTVRQADRTVRSADRRTTERGNEVKLAFAAPDNPGRDKTGNPLRNLFNGPKAGAGVAVYDISAAKVYMPDGSVLEAHSGIGKMVDNPRYVNVKMGGPTPPHTYNLKMRERRFHGVEAIRMLPVDGKNKHGRSGFLTHSYLLRGGRAESHGCVAFKDYNKFLNAFKRGKIKQLVVVSGGGRAAVQFASNTGKKAQPVTR